MSWCFREILSCLSHPLRLLLLLLLLLSHASLGVELSQHMIHPRIRRSMAPGIHAFDRAIRSSMQDVAIAIVVVLRIAGVARRALIGAVGCYRVAARADAGVGKGYRWRRQ